MKTLCCVVQVGEGNDSINDRSNVSAANGQKGKKKGMEWLDVYLTTQWIPQDMVLLLVNGCGEESHRACVDGNGYKQLYGLGPTSIPSALSMQQSDRLFFVQPATTKTRLRMGEYWMETGVMDMLVALDRDLPTDVRFTFIIVSNQTATLPKSTLQQLFITLTGQMKQRRLFKKSESHVKATVRTMDMSMQPVTQGGKDQLQLSYEPHILPLFTIPSTTHAQEREKSRACIQHVLFPRCLQIHQHVFQSQQFIARQTPHATDPTLAYFRHVHAHFETALMTMPTWAIYWYNNLMSKGVLQPVRSDGHMANRDTGVNDATLVVRYNGKAFLKWARDMAFMTPQQATRYSIQRGETLQSSSPSYLVQEPSFPRNILPQTPVGISPASAMVTAILREIVPLHIASFDTLKETHDTRTMAPATKIPMSSIRVAEAPKPLRTDTHSNDMPMPLTPFEKMDISTACHDAASSTLITPSQLSRPNNVPMPLIPLEKLDISTRTAPSQLPCSNDVSMPLIPLEKMDPSILNKPSHLSRSNDVLVPLIPLEKMDTSSACHDAASSTLTSPSQLSRPNDEPMSLIPLEKMDAPTECHGTASRKPTMHRPLIQLENTETSAAFHGAVPSSSTTPIHPSCSSDTLVPPLIQMAEKIVPSTICHGTASSTLTSPRQLSRSNDLTGTLIHLDEMDTSTTLHNSTSSAISSTKASVDVVKPSALKAEVITAIVAPKENAPCSITSSIDAMDKHGSMIQEYDGRLDVTLRCTGLKPNRLPTNAFKSMMETDNDSSKPGMPRCLSSPLDHEGHDCLPLASLPQASVFECLVDMCSQSAAVYRPSYRIIMSDYSPMWPLIQGAEAEMIVVGETVFEEGLQKDNRGFDLHGPISSEPTCATVYAATVSLLPCIESEGNGSSIPKGRLEPLEFSTLPMFYGSSTEAVDKAANDALSFIRRLIEFGTGDKEDSPNGDTFIRDQVRVLIKPSLEEFQARPEDIVSVSEGEKDALNVTKTILTCPSKEKITTEPEIKNDVSKENGTASLPDKDFISAATLYAKSMKEKKLEWLFKEERPGSFSCSVVFMGKTIRTNANDRFARKVLAKKEAARLLCEEFSIPLDRPKISKFNQYGRRGRGSWRSRGGHFRQQYARNTFRGHCFDDRMYGHRHDYRYDKSPSSFSYVAERNHTSRIYTSEHQGTHNTSSNGMELLSALLNANQHPPVLAGHAHTTPHQPQCLHTPSAVEDLDKYFLSKTLAHPPSYRFIPFQNQIQYQVDLHLYDRTVRFVGLPMFDGAMAKEDCAKKAIEGIQLMGNGNIGT